MSAVFFVSPVQGGAPLFVVAQIEDTVDNSLLGTVDWNWGDGSAHDTLNDTYHIYESIGVYNLVCTTSLQGQFTRTITVVDPNTPVIAVNDTYTVAEGSSLTANVGDNDSAGANLAAANWQVTTSPLHGVISPWPGDGSFTYTPNTGFQGVDTFTYTLINNESLDQSGPATVTITVGNAPPSTRPSIKAWYNGKQVYLGVQENALVFDGQNFVRPQDAEYVAIVETVTVGPKLVPPEWPETRTLEQEQLTWTNVWLCGVIAINQESISDIDVVAVTDPNNGACVCGISCSGTDLQYVQVTLVP